MQSFYDAVSSGFQFLSNAEVLGLSLVTWIAISIVVTALGFIIRGNK